MAEDKALNSVVPPAEDKHTAPKETVFGKELSEGAPVSASGPVGEGKVQSALSSAPAPKTDAADDTPKAADVKELKSDVGGAEAAPIVGGGEKPAPTKTVEEAAKESSDKKEEPIGGSKTEEAAKPEKEAPATNGPSANVNEKGEPAAVQAGGKRAAVNGGEADGPAEKKAKTATPTTNGGTARGKGKREKKQPAPVGQTARRTRSQGLAEV